jgi:ubiquinone/menaquinone biosynthesis C-methylase UbiE
VTTYLHPLAYLLGIEGVALLRGLREGTCDRAFVESRLAEIRALLEDPSLAEAEGVEATLGGISVGEVYREWAPVYDEPNSLIAAEEPIVREILATLPVGTALDAACGTGRHAAYLSELGHRVIGADASPEMLAIAAKKLPDAELHRADLHRIPVPDASVDAVVCGLALSYLPDLAPIFAEFARVLRPGGHLVISDAHQLLSYVSPRIARTAAGADHASILAEYHRPLSDYLAAALPLGFQVRQCSEPRRQGRVSAIASPPPKPWPTHVSWELLNWCPEAAHLAFGVPQLVVWHFQLAGD